MIWSCDTGQLIPSFDSCQLAITWMINIKESDVPCKLAGDKYTSIDSLNLSPQYGHIGNSRLLPKKIFREPCGLPKLKVSSPNHFFKSPELVNSSWDHIYKKVRMNQVRHPFGLLVQKFGHPRSQIRRPR